ncbi:hypothetical protein AWZ03_009192 [Drosophila navojoa]|uniref:Uncharacterized protein n=1 Tax=Drosophila navojoa TaxID=7232 RepID=A0A484B6V9_DRONA|nr:hypothetical protein AWZ03_009192 [Drosophila navojoa]
MKSIVFLTLLVVVTMAIAQPVVKETFEVKEKAVSLADLEEEQPAAPVDHQRYKRATCDLLSFLNLNGCRSNEEYHVAAFDYPSGNGNSSNYYYYYYGYYYFYYYYCSSSFEGGTN